MIRWLWRHLCVYFAVAALSGILFFVGAFIYAKFASAQSTKTALQTQIANCFPTQTVGAITPPITVTCMNAIIASMQQYAGVNAQTTTSYTFLQSDYGQLVTFNNTGATSATLPQAISSAFYPWNAFVKNLGAGAVNLLPIGSTVNSATTLQLTQGQSVWLVSDGTNYLAWNASGSGGPVVSVTASDGSLTIAPTFGSILASINTSHANTWIASQVFSASSLGIGGPAGGVGTLVGQGTGPYTLQFPSANDTVVYLAAPGNITGKTFTSDTYAGLSTFTGQIFPSFGTPTIASGACGAGSNGTLATSSVNQAGKIVIGASATSGCSVGFSQTLTQTPIACTFVPASAPAATWQTSSVYIAALSNSAFTLGGNTLANTNWYYHCY